MSRNRTRGTKRMAPENDMVSSRPARMMPGGGYLGALIAVFAIGLMTAAATAVMGAGSGLAAGIFLATLTAAAGTLFTDAADGTLYRLDANL